MAVKGNIAYLFWDVLERGGYCQSKELLGKQRINPTWLGYKKYSKGL